MYDDTLKFKATSHASVDQGVSVGGVSQPPIGIEKLTEPALCDWIATAAAGDAIQYHEGFLIMDRSDSFSGLPYRERQRLNALAKRAWIACELGLVHLFSNRIAECHYKYIAVRANTNHTPPEIRSRLKTATPTNHAN